MTLENLVRINQLKREAPDKMEFENLIKLAKERLTDAQHDNLSFSSRFDLAYNAAYGLALSALRANEYRSDKRYIVFQCLVHTTHIDKVRLRILLLCHEKRNLTEYEGYIETDEALLSALIDAAKYLLKLVETLKVD